MKRRTREVRKVLKDSPIIGYPNDESISPQAGEERKEREMKRIDRRDEERDKSNQDCMISS